MLRLTRRSGYTVRKATLRRWILLWRKAVILRWNAHRKARCGLLLETCNERKSRFRSNSVDVIFFSTCSVPVLPVAGRLACMVPVTMPCSAMWVSCPGPLFLVRRIDLHPAHMSTCSWNCRPRTSFRFGFYAPEGGHIKIGPSVRPSVRPSVCPSYFCPGCNSVILGWILK